MNGRHVSSIGNWNVKTLRNKESGVKREMELYSLNILGLSETNVQSNGKKVIDEAGYVYAHRVCAACFH